MTKKTFLGLQIDNHVNWENHVELMIPKLSGVCYAVWSMVHISDITTLKSIYFSYFRSFIKYAIIFWVNSSSSAKVFTLQKKIIRMWLVLNQEHYAEVCLKKSEIFQTNSFVRSINTRNKHSLLRPNANSSCFQKGAFYAGISIFTSLLHSLSILMNDKVTLKKYLNTHSFYSVDDFFKCKDNNTVV